LNRNGLCMYAPSGHTQHINRSRHPTRDGLNGQPFRVGRFSLTIKVERSAQTSVGLSPTKQSTRTGQHPHRTPCSPDLTYLRPTSPCRTNKCVTKMVSFEENYLQPVSSTSSTSQSRRILKWLFANRFSHRQAIHIHRTSQTSDRSLTL
jgi:hypothetical protein